MSKSDIVIDLTKITKRQMVTWRQSRREIINDEENTDPMALEVFDFDTLFKVVITAWPFGKIDLDTFLDLPYPDSVSVDNAVTAAILELTQKK